MKKSVLFGLDPLIFMWLASCAAPLIQSETLVASDDVPRAAELKARAAAEKTCAEGDNAPAASGLCRY